MGEKKPLQAVFLLTDKPIININPKKLIDHPLNIELFGDLPEDEYQTLKNDIDGRGIQDPLHVVEKGKKKFLVVSGHQRKKIAIDLGIDVPCIVRDDLKEDWQIEEQLIADNLLRRHLSDYQIIKVSIKREEIEREKSKFRKLSTLKQGDKSPDMQNFAERSKGNTRDKLAEPFGISGEQYRKAKKVYFDAPEKIKEKWKNEKLSTHKAYQKTVLREKKRKKKEKQVELGKKIKITDKDIKLICKDFRDASEIKDNSIDLILTDPPYPYEYIDLWSGLSEFANRVLKPNGFCIAYSGHINLPEVMQRMGSHLSFYWICSLVHNGSTKLVTARNIIAGWKPILIYQKEFKKNENQIEDVITGTGREKEGHDWQQAEEEIKVFIENFTDIGETILDPFMGSGTTLFMSKKLNRKSIGIEIDKDTFDIAKGRIFGGDVQ